MLNLKNYLLSKRKQLETIRGNNRMRNTKFMTQITENKEQKSNEMQSDEKKGNNNNNNNNEMNVIKMEGYIKKQSKHLKQFRKRYIILQNKCLYSYKTHKKQQLTE
eukprot:192839_1